jgi:hypothetical protein
MENEPVNPYEPPADAESLSGRRATVCPSRAATLRRKCAAAETFVRVLVWVNYIGFGLNLLLIAGSIWVTIVLRGSNLGRSLSASAWTVFLLHRFALAPLFAGLHFALGRGLSRLEPWARAAQLLLSVAVVGLLLLSRIWFGTANLPGASHVLAFLTVAAHVGIAYVLTSRLGTRVFGPRYHAVVEATPGLGRRPGWMILLGTLIAGLIVSAGVGSLSLSLATVLGPWLTPPQPAP